MGLGDWGPVHLGHRWGENEGRGGGNERGSTLNLFEERREGEKLLGKVYTDMKSRVKRVVGG